MNKIILTLALFGILLTGCTVKNTASEEQQAMATALGISVEEMLQLSDEEFSQRMNELSADQSEG